MEKKLIILQLNEVNFDLVKKYILKGNLPNFKYFINKYNLIETTSESKPENLEPWIQWVSFYSGKKFDDHKVSHLNDFEANQWNFFSHIEKKLNKKLALLFPMNLKNSFSKNNFFLPDPWTETNINSDIKTKKIFKIFKKLVLQNASNKLCFSDFSKILLFSFLNTSLTFKFYLFRNIFKIIKFKFYKALVFDYLCWEIFKQKEKKSFDLISLFLNSCAHIQHHYLLNSIDENSQSKNPSWYISGIDPVFECLKLYDLFLSELKNLDNVDFIILTGLSQSAIRKPEFYYNLKENHNFFKKINVNFKKKIKRMSRDYTLYFNNRKDAEVAKKQLSAIKLNGSNFFYSKIIDNIVYVELVYNKEIREKDLIYVNNFKKLKIKEYVNFIAIKNSIHNQKGYLISSIKGYKKMSIWDVHKNVLKYYES